MRRVIVAVIAVVGCGMALLSVQAAPVPKTPEVTTDPPKWEHKAVTFGADEKEATKKLTELGLDGWEYVGPLGNGLVAFKRAIPTPEEVAVRKELAKWQGAWALEDNAEVTMTIKLVSVTPPSPACTSSSPSSARWRSASRPPSSPACPS